MSAHKYLFLIGAPKCGTTSIAAKLGAEDRVAVAASKEPRFFTDYGSVNWSGPAGRAFARSIPADFAAYDAEFTHRPEAEWRVDASTDYLSCPVSAQRIAEFAGTDHAREVLVAVILRDPVARAISEYAHTLRDGYEAETLRRSIELEEERIDRNWHPLFHHVRRSRYAEAVATYRAMFGDRLLVLDYHEMEAGFARLAGAMGLAGGADRGLSRANASYTPKSLAFQKVWRNPAVTAVARALVPKALRGGLRRRIEALNASDTRPDQADVDLLRQRLADDIRACIDDPGIPTGGWTLARG